MVRKTVGKGKKKKTITVPETREQTEYFEAGFLLTTFDQYGYLIQESVPLERGDSLTYNAESLFGIDINGDGEEGLNISSVDELQELQSYGFTTFDEDYTNQTDLYIDANTGDLYFASVDTPDNKLELIDFDGENFGINTQDGFTPIAVETVDIPSLSQYSGTYVLLAYDEYFNEFVGFLFDEYGNYLEDLGAPNNPQAINDAEHLFGVDLNEDDVQGRNVQIVDTASYLSDNGISTLEDATNTKDLYKDSQTGELLFSDASDSSSQQSLYNRDGYNYISQDGQTAVDIEQDSDGNLQLLSYREAGSITTFFTQMVKKKVGKGKNRKTVKVPEIREQIEYFDAGFVLTTFDSAGYLIQELSLIHI